MFGQMGSQCTLPPASVGGEAMNPPRRSRYFFLFKELGIYDKAPTARRAFPLTDEFDKKRRSDLP